MSGLIRSSLTLKPKENIRKTTGKTLENQLEPQGPWPGSGVVLSLGPHCIKLKKYFLHFLIQIWTFQTSEFDPGGDFRTESEIEAKNDPGTLTSLVPIGRFWALSWVVCVCTKGRNVSSGKIWGTCLRPSELTGLDEIKIQRDKYGGGRKTMAPFKGP